MIKLIQKQDILIMVFRDGKSQRAIERETRVSRKTISISENTKPKGPTLLEMSPDAVVGIKELTDSIVTAPKYDSSNRNKRKVTKEVLGCHLGTPGWHLRGPNGRRVRH